MRRHALSLFELLALLAVLAILLGLLLPAVEKVREAAAKSQSMNNLKQIAISVHQYVDTNGSMPPGCDGKHFSAFSRVLPYIEQDNVFKTIDFDKEMTDKDNAAARGTVIRTFISPLDSEDRPNKDFGATSYQFVAGSKMPLEDNDGCFYLNSATRFADIKDGTSNTLMAVETLLGRATPKDSVARQYVRLKKADLKDLNDDSGVKQFKDGKDIVADRGASWMDGRFLQGTIAMNRGLNDERPDVDCEGAGGLAGPRSLQGRAIVSLCDGSVRVITSGIKPDTLKALATHSGGEVIGDDF